MRDDMFSRTWADHHADFSTEVAGFLRRLIQGFERLEAIQFAAPWRSPPPPQA